MKRQDRASVIGGDHPYNFGRAAQGIHVVCRDLEVGLLWQVSEHQVITMCQALCWVLAAPPPPLVLKMTLYTLQMRKQRLREWNAFPSPPSWCSQNGVSPVLLLSQDSLTALESLITDQDRVTGTGQDDRRWWGWERCFRGLRWEYKLFLHLHVEEQLPGNWSDAFEFSPIYLPWPNIRTRAMESLRYHETCSCT
jgi:hypothetical protein